MRYLVNDYHLYKNSVLCIQEFFQSHVMKKSTNKSNNMTIHCENCNVIGVRLFQVKVRIEKPSQVHENNEGVCCL